MYLGMSCIWYVMYLDMSLIRVCHVLGYVMYLDMSCIWVCHVFWYAMHLGMTCIRVCHVFGYVMYLGIYLKSDSTHHFFRNASTKSGSLRFSQFFGC